MKRTILNKIVLEELESGTLDLSGVPHDKPGAIDEIYKLATTGKATVVKCSTEEGRELGVAVYGLDFEMSELVVYLVKCVIPDLDIWLAINETLAELGRRHGLKRMQCITIRPGLVRKAIHSGWRISEVVLRKEI